MSPAYPACGYRMEVRHAFQHFVPSATSMTKPFTLAKVALSLELLRHSLEEMNKDLTAEIDSETLAIDPASLRTTIKTDLWGEDI